MLHLVLYQPESPPNTGNIIRLCANTGVQLHIIEPMGFEWDDKRLRRAGLDYREFAAVQRHASLQEFQENVRPAQLFAVSTRGDQHYHELAYQPGDALMLGPETRGLPDEVLDQLGREHCLRIPMQAHSRSLNLSNAAAVLVYEALRQLEFPGLQ